MLASIWENAGELLTKSFSKVDRILLGRDAAGELVGFSTWNVKALRLAGGRSVAASYIGIGALSSKFQSKGWGKKIIYGGIHQASAELQQHFPGMPRWAYSTTISPIGYLGLVAGFSTAFNPRTDGQFDSSVMPILTAVKAELGVKPSHETPGQPFVLRAFSSTRYRSEVSGSLRRVADEQQIALFREHQLSETNGDRVLMIFAV